MDWKYALRYALIAAVLVVGCLIGSYVAGQVGS